jgi:ABC-type transport system substrate-binding protein
MGIDCNVNSLNPFQETTYCDAYVVEELYDGMYNTLPSGSVVPWLATGYTVQHVTTDNTTYDILTNTTENYSYVYTVHLRPYVQWTDWTPANASQTYTFSNVLHFNFNGKPTTHVFKSYKNTTMKTYYLQSGDVVQSFRMEQSCGDWPNVVSVVPDGNLSVKVFVSKQTLLLFPDDFENDVLPYHIWIKHDFTSVDGLYNYTPGISSGNGWYDWNMGWNTATGRSPGSVGTGPFMVQNSYGMPEGAIIPSHVETMYVNPHYFVQYANKTSGLRQYTPKIYEIDEPFFTSESSMIAAYQKGQIDTTSLAPDPSFLPQIQSTSGSYIYHKTSSAYGYFRINTRVAPLNITAFRQALNYATPTAYIASTISDGYAKLSSDPVNPENTLYYNSSAPEYTLDMAKATELIKSIPGMDNVSGTLEYYGKPVVITIQTTVGSVAPDNIEGIDATEKYWNELGIKVNLKEEAFTTLISNIDGSISENTNLYEVGDLGLSTAIGDPALDCRELVNPTYGIPTDKWVGPFSSCTINGKTLNGTQVQSLFDNITSKAVSTDKISTAEYCIDNLQSLMIREATMVNLGYGIDLIPEQTNAFTNYSHTNPDAVYIYWYWQFFSLEKVSKPVKVHYNYTLTVTASLNNATREYSGDKGTITFTVTNGTTPVSGATVLVGISANYGGIINTTSNNLTTNANGQVMWKYHIEKLSTLFINSNSQNNLVNLYYEEANITAVASVSNAKQTGPGNATQTIWLINPSLDVSCSYSQSVYTPGETGNITFTVTENGTAYAGAVITVNTKALLNITYSNSELTLTTNSKGMAVFSFTVQKNISQVLAGTDFGNTTFSISVSESPSSSTHLVGANATVSIPLTVAKPKSTGLSTLDEAAIGGGVAAVVVVGAASYMLFLRKPKIPKVKS